MFNIFNRQSKLLDISRLTTLQGLADLRLQDNQLEGGLPTDWTQAGRWQNLTRLDLHSNRLSGSLPPAWNEWSILPNLTM